MRIHCQQSPRGSASIVVLVLVILVGSLLVSNSRALHDLKRNLRRIEQKQCAKFGVTNNVTAKGGNGILPVQTVSLPAQKE